MRIVLHIIHALNCGFSSVLVKTSDFDVIVILIRQLSCFETIIAVCKTTENYGIGKTQRVLRARLQGSGVEFVGTKILRPDWQVSVRENCF